MAKLCSSIGLYWTELVACIASSLVEVLVGNQPYFTWPTYFSKNIFFEWLLLRKIVTLLEILFIKVIYIFEGKYMLNTFPICFWRCLPCILCHIHMIQPTIIITSLVLTAPMDFFGNGNPLHYSYLENPMNREAWWVIVHRITKSWTLSEQLTLSHFQRKVTKN